MLTAHDYQLLIVAVVAIAAVILLIAKFKLHPFLALMICAIALGLAGGQDAAAVMKSVLKGFGDIAANVGIVLALGAMFGGLLAKSRGADRIATSLILARGPGFAPWAMAGLAMVLGLPVFFETGVVMMMPIIVAAAVQIEKAGGGKAGSPYLLAGLPAIAGLSTLHGLVPPHPGPLVAINALGANVGTTLLYGVVMAVPIVIIAGPLYTRYIATRATANPPPQLIREFAQFAPDVPMPGAAITLVTVLFPIALMMAKACVDLILPPGSAIGALLDFVGAL